MICGDVLAKFSLSFGCWIIYQVQYKYCPLEKRSVITVKRREIGFVLWRRQGEISNPL